MLPATDHSEMHSLLVDRLFHLPLPVFSLENSAESRLSNRAEKAATNARLETLEQRLQKCDQDRASFAHRLRRARDDKHALVKKLAHFEAALQTTACERDSLKSALSEDRHLLAREKTSLERQLREERAHVKTFKDLLDRTETRAQGRQEDLLAAASRLSERVQILTTSESALQQEREERQLEFEETIRSKETQWAEERDILADKLNDAVAREEKAIHSMNSGIASISTSLNRKLADMEDRGKAREIQLLHQESKLKDCIQNLSVRESTLKKRLQQLQTDYDEVKRSKKVELSKQKAVMESKLKEEIEARKHAFDSAQAGHAAEKEVMRQVLEDAKKHASAREQKLKAMAAAMSDRAKTLMKSETNLKAEIVEIRRSFEQTLRSKEEERNTKLSALAAEAEKTSRDHESELRKVRSDATSHATTLQGKLLETEKQAESERQKLVRDNEVLTMRADDVLEGYNIMKEKYQAEAEAWEEKFLIQKTAWDESREKMEMEADSANKLHMDELKDVRRAADLEINSLRQEAATAKRITLSAEEQLKELSSHHAAVTTELRSVKNVKKDMQSERDIALQQLASMMSENEGTKRYLQSAQAHAEQQEAALQRQLDDQNSLLKDLQSAMKEKDTFLTVAKEHATAVDQQVSDLKATVEGKDNELFAATECIAILRRQYSELEGKIGKMAGELATSEVVLREAEARMKSLESEGENLRSQLSGAQEELTRSERTFQEKLARKDKELGEAVANAVVMDDGGRFSISDNIHFGREGSLISSDSVSPNGSDGRSFSPRSSKGTRSPTVTPPTSPEQRPERKSLAAAAPENAVLTPSVASTSETPSVRHPTSAVLFADRDRHEEKRFPGRTQEEPSPSSPKPKWDRKRSRTTLHTRQHMEDSFRSLQKLMVKKDRGDLSEDWPTNGQRAGFTRRSLSQIIRGKKNQTHVDDVDSHSMSLTGLLRKKSPTPTNTAQVALPKASRTAKKAASLRRLTDAFTSNMKLRK